MTGNYRKKKLISNPKILKTCKHIDLRIGKLKAIDEIQSKKIKIHYAVPPKIYGQRKTLKYDDLRARNN